MCHCLDKRIWFTIVFLLLKESLTVFQVWIFLIIPSLIFSQLELSRIELPKLTNKYFNGKLWQFHLPWLVSSIFICSCPYGLAFEKFVFELDASLEAYEVFEKPMRLRVFDLQTKFITSDKTLIRRLWEIVVYNVVKSKVELFLAFFLGIYFTQFCNNWE